MLVGMAIKLFRRSLLVFTESISVTTVTKIAMLV